MSPDWHEQGAAAIRRALELGQTEIAESMAFFARHAIPCSRCHQAAIGVCPDCGPLADAAICSRVRCGKRAATRSRWCKDHSPRFDREPPPGTQPPRKLCRIREAVARFPDWSPEALASYTGTTAGIVQRERTAMGLTWKESVA